MQLKKKIRQSLATATSTLLATSVHAIDLQAVSPIEISATTLVYQESNGVGVFKPMLKLRKELESDRFLSTTLVFDSISGASPNGAVPATTSQSFTSPSGLLYTVSANTQPKRDFRDIRNAVSADFETPIGENKTLIIAGNISSETDYLATGISSTLNWDFNQRLTSLSAAFSYSAETVTPTSGVPTALSPIQPKSTTGTSEEKQVSELQLGVTQVVTAKILTQLTYNYGKIEGYQTDPYKIISLINGTTGNPSYLYHYEGRPEQRKRQSIYGQYIQHLSEDSFRLGYRYFWDDWQIQSHTLDGYYRFTFDDGHYLQPHIRLYQQSAASFFRYALINGETLPNYASADLRLAQLNTLSIGLQYGFTLLGGEVVTRIEQMTQTGKPSSADQIGELKTLDIHPTLEATIVQLSYYIQF